MNGNNTTAYPSCENYVTIKQKGVETIKIRGHTTLHIARVKLKLVD